MAEDNHPSLATSYLIDNSVLFNEEYFFYNPLPVLALDVGCFEADIISALR